MTGSARLPVIGCLVKAPSGCLAFVKRTFPESQPPLVELVLQPTGEVALAPASGVRSGYETGMEVIDSPDQRRRKSLGFGEVLTKRTLGGRDQVLVEFAESGQRAWLPCEGLRLAKGVRHRFVLEAKSEAGQAERLRLRMLAHAIESWNVNTGAFSRLDIDPLPHQIHLVHHILASGNHNWMIADDVGLGKTIEAGMLIAALRARGLARRVLILTPAGLTRQWKEEMFSKFGIEECEVYGDDFRVNEPRQWKLHDFVIGSMDRMKMDQHLDSLLLAEDWDLMIVDEAHRLSRRQYGMKFESSERFRLTQALRPRVRAMVLLTGTPHQGMQDKFSALLELMRPEYKNVLATLTLHPEVIGQMVYRNYKADVTDAAGEFVFQGQTTRSIQVEVSAQARRFDRRLQDYLRRGYMVSREGGMLGVAIGFVMTTYRKLAASSVAAIVCALQARRQRIIERGIDPAADGPGDTRFQGEWEESRTGDGKEFFEGELRLLDKLIQRGEQLRGADAKLRGFLESIVEGVLNRDPEGKLLIFTEYRNTQVYLRAALQARYGVESVQLINGSMDLDERRRAIQDFEEAGRFLISTEAGGEGINLHRRCHTMVNYDLPWNPMRLVQRVGRLYRYGQQRRVLVFNLHARGTIDEDVVEMMYRRLDAVVADMAAVQSLEFNERLKDDILGEVADLVDFEEILDAGAAESVERTQERVDEALKRAREAAAVQRELFRHAAKYDPGDFAAEFQVGMSHFEAFVRGMFAILEVEIVEEGRSGQILRLRLPERVHQAIGQRASRMEVTFDRRLASDRPGIHCLDLASPLVQFLIVEAKSYAFGGLATGVGGLTEDAAVAGILRWQDDQGRRVRESFAVYERGTGGVRVNTPEFMEWLLQPAAEANSDLDRAGREGVWREIVRASDKSLALASNEYLHPEGVQWVAGALGGDNGGSSGTPSES